jgi:hypothetical protein
MLTLLSLRLSASRKPAREISPCSVLSAGQKSHGHWQSQCYLCAGAIHSLLRCQQLHAARPDSITPHGA